MASTADYKLGEVVIEGKTKIVYDLRDSLRYGDGTCVLVKSKDKITCGDGARQNIMEGKGAIANSTNGSIFKFLNESGVRTHYKEQTSETEFIAERCEMIPIEFVMRRLATGSYLKRNPGVEEGFRFPEPLLEYFFKDDENHDPQWSRGQILETKFEFAGLKIGRLDLDQVSSMALATFEILEKAWASRGCVLVDMKIEFGVNTKAEIVLADVIDNDSWRLWPMGDKRLMRDKQVYRNLKEVTSEAMAEIKKNYSWVAEEATKFITKPSAQVVMFMGSASDAEHCRKIEKKLTSLGVPAHMRVSSAHKGTEETLRLLRYYECHGIPTVFIAVAGRSNGLGPVLSGNTAYPVINSPPVKSDWGAQDIWSSMRLPSGLGCTTIIDPEGAALAAAQILGMTDHNVWCKLRAMRLNTACKLMQDDKKMQLEQAGDMVF